MDRRRFLLTSLAILVAPLPAAAQQAASPHRVGFSMPNSPPAHPAPAVVQAFRNGRRDVGYIEGQHIAIEFRWADGQLDRLPDLAAELVRLKVSVIVTGSAQAIRAAKAATDTIPIVMGAASDPV